MPSTKQRVCVTCGGHPERPAAGQRRAEWLRETDHVKEFIERQTDFNPRGNRYCPSKQATHTLTPGKQHAGRLALYWATTRAPDGDLAVQGAKKAYGAPRFPNSGIARVRADGTVRASLACPQVYRAKEAGASGPARAYRRHAHYVLADRKATRWMSNNVRTETILCTSSLARLRSAVRSGKAVVLNTLPEAAYAVDHIPHTWSVPYTLGPAKAEARVKDIVRLHLPALRKVVASRRLTLHEVPIITYCAHEKCDASHRAMRKLESAGFVNLFWFPGGMREATRAIRGA